MNDFFQALWLPALMLSGAFIAASGAFAHAWQKVRTADADARLKQAMLARGLSMDEMQVLLQPPAMLDEQLVEKLGNLLAERDAATIEYVMRAFDASDLPRKRLLYHAILGLCEGGDPSEEQMLAVVVGLGRPAPAPTQSAQASDAQGIFAANP
jgi:hypothetical protein